MRGPVPFQPPGGANFFNLPPPSGAGGLYPSQDPQLMGARGPRRPGDAAEAEGQDAKRPRVGPPAPGPMGPPQPMVPAFRPMMPMGGPPPGYWAPMGAGPPPGMVGAPRGPPPVLQQQPPLQQQG
jgi:hypothetical protein